MQRRDFLKRLSFTTAGALALQTHGSMAAASAANDRPAPFLLSSHGCGRATAYAETNKIVSLDGKTHVVWLDSVGDKFPVRVRTLDRNTGSWSETYTVGNAYDNHGGPALTFDSHGYLHIVYHPHHHPFRYRRSTRPNDASQWEPEERFGTRCTYPTLLCGPDDTLYATCRESDTDPWVVNLYTKRPGAAWEKVGPLLRAQLKGYSHYQEALAWGPDFRTIHLSCRIYDGGQPRAVGYLQSPDFGKSWQRSDGTPVELPATADSVTVVAGEKEFSGLRCANIAVDSTGKPHLLYCAASPGPSRAWIARPDESGAWPSLSLQEAAADLPIDGGLVLPGCMTFDTKDRIHAAMSIINPPKDESTWGHASNEVVLIQSSDRGQKFSARLVAQPDPTTSRWLPNLERPTGHNRVVSPGLIYTSGPPGGKNTDMMANEVYWVDTA